LGRLPPTAFVDREDRAPRCLARPPDQREVVALRLLADLDTRETRERGLESERRLERGEVLSEKIRRYRSVFARMPDLPFHVGFVVDSGLTSA
jgi:hypothetical protein